MLHPALGAEFVQMPARIRPQVSSISKLVAVKFFIVAQRSTEEACHQNLGGGGRAAGGGSHGRLRGCQGPLLCTPLLADIAANTVDARTVKYLFQPALKLKEEGEETGVGR